LKLCWTDADVSPVHDVDEFDSRCLSAGRIESETT
jgi:hypothetical protein